MQKPSRFFRIARILAWTGAPGIIFVLSYAPFLWCVTHPEQLELDLQYRAPSIYRPVEWLIVKTPMQGALLKWADCFRVKSTTEFQAWYFAQGVEDASGFEFNIVD